MGVIINQSIKSSIISYLGILLGAFNILWLYPKYLNPAEFGLIRLLQDIPFLIALFAQLGTSGIIDRFYFQLRDTYQNNNFKTILFFYPLIGYSIFTLSFFLFNDFWKSIFLAKSDLLLEYFIYLIPLAFFVMYTSVCEAFLRSHLNISLGNFVREILMRIFYTAFVIVYALKLVSFEGFIFLVVIGYGISLLVLLIYSFKKNVISLPLAVQLPEKNLQNQIGSYLIYLIPGTAGSLIAQKIDTIMLASISGVKENEGLINIAIYSLAYFIGSVVEVPKKTISHISIPILSNAFKNNDLKIISELYKKNSTNQFLVGLFIFTSIWINIDYLFLFIPNSDLYAQGKYVILLIGISKLFDMATSINGEIIQFSSFYRYNLVSILLLSLLTIILNFILIPLYSINGAAIALAITVFLFNGFKTVIVWQKLKLTPFSKDLYYLFLLSLVIILYAQFHPFQVTGIVQSLIPVLIQNTLFIIVFYSSIRYLRISSDLNQLIDKLLGKVSHYTKLNWLKKL